MTFKLFIFKSHAAFGCSTSTTLIMEISTVATTLIIEISTTTTTMSSSAFTEAIESMAETRILISGLLPMTIFSIPTWSTSSHFWKTSIKHPPYCFQKGVRHAAHLSLRNRAIFFSMVLAMNIVI
jgi:hypothetical protein